MPEAIDLNTAASKDVSDKAPLVGVIMGSSSDWDVMQHATAVLDAFGIAYDARVVSAHRMPHDMFEYGASAAERGLRAIIAGAGGAAHLPGMMAALTAAGIEVITKPEWTMPGVGRFARIHDLEGNPIELWEPEEE